MTGGGTMTGTSGRNRQKHAVAIELGMVANRQSFAVHLAGPDHAIELFLASAP